MHMIKSNIKCEGQNMSPPHTEAIYKVRELELHFDYKIYSLKNLV